MTGQESSFPGLGAATLNSLSQSPRDETPCIQDKHAPSGSLRGYNPRGKGNPSGISPSPDTLVRDGPGLQPGAGGRPE